MSIQKISVSLFLLVIPFLIICAGRKRETPTTILEGEIYITGNEPFTRVAFEDTTGVVYFLSCTEAMEKALQKHQNRPIRLYASQLIRVQKQNRITVERYELIKQEK